MTAGRSGQKKVLLEQKGDVVGSEAVGGIDEVAESAFELSGFGRLVDRYAIRLAVG